MIDKPKEWWLRRADSEPDVDITAGVPQGGDCVHFKIIRRFSRRDRGQYSAHAWLVYGARLSARGATVVLANQALDKKLDAHIQESLRRHQCGPVVQP